MHSIRSQILSVIAGLLIVLLVLLNIYPLTTSRDIIFEEKQSSMVSQAMVISSSLSNLDRLTGGGVREVLTLLDISNYTGMAVISADGALLYSKGNVSGVASRSEDLDTALAGKTVFRSLFADSAFSSVCIVPIGPAAGVTGAVYLFEQDTERADIILKIQSQIRVTSLIVSAVFLLITLVITRLLLRRLSELVRSMRIVASGDYSHRTVPSGQDEITELSNEFNDLTQRLDENERQRRRFVSDASHELKTPLASIRLLSDSIAQAEHMDILTAREFAEDIGNEAERLQNTTEKLLDLSRLDDDVQIVPIPVDVKQTVYDANVVLKPLADEKSVHVRLELEDGCVVMATTDDLFHIVFNLMENAVKYNEPGGSVVVRLTSDDSAVRLTVEDTGIGIPESERLNVFTRFYRVDKARSREAGGSGLGLSIVHDAVLTHGGTIAVGENKPKGSVFIVTFPRPSAEETGI